MADTTLYGSARISLDYDKVKASTPRIVVPDTWPSNRIPGPRVLYSNDQDESVWDVTNNASRLGVKGSERWLRIAYDAGLLRLAPKKLSGNHIRAAVLAERLRETNHAECKPPRPELQILGC